MGIITERGSGVNRRVASNPAAWSGAALPRPISAVAWHTLCSNVSLSMDFSSRQRREPPAPLGTTVKSPARQ
jgi:hypothetical protein